MAEKKKAPAKKEKVVKAPVVVEAEVEATPEVEKKKEISPKFKTGDIVYIGKAVESDLNGVGLFPQHKKYTYTVEAYDAKADIYTIRRLNALLLLKGEDLLSPDEKGHDPLHRVQY